MTFDETLARVNREGQQRKIDDIFYTTLENIFSVYGGEDKLSDWDAAVIRGALVRAKTAALIPSEIKNGKEAPNAGSVASSLGGE